MNDWDDPVERLPWEHLPVTRAELEQPFHGVRRFKKRVHGDREKKDWMGWLAGDEREAELKEAELIPGEKCELCENPAEHRRYPVHVSEPCYRMISLCWPCWVKQIEKERELR